MSPFGIFTIVLVSLYLVYYAILITRDIYGKKNAVKCEEEEFDILSMQDEHAAVNVEESESGFSMVPFSMEGREAKPVSPAVSGVSNQHDTNHNEAVVTLGTTPDDAESFAIPTSDPATASSGEPTAASGGGASATQEKINKMQEEMEEIDPMGNLTMSKEFFRDLLLQANKEGSLFVQKAHVPTV